MMTGLARDGGLYLPESIPQMARADIAAFIHAASAHVRVRVAAGSKEAAASALAVTERESALAGIITGHPDMLRLLDVVRKVAADLGSLSSPDAIRAKLAELLPVAKAQLVDEV
jgi:hypothetical protein